MRVVFFDSYESAMENSNLPETAELDFGQQMAGDQHGATGGGVAADKLAQPADPFEVETVGGLVQQLSPDARSVARRGRLWMANDTVDETSARRRRVVVARDGAVWA